MAHAEGNTVLAPLQPRGLSCCERVRGFGGQRPQLGAEPLPLCAGHAALLKTNTGANLVGPQCFWMAWGSQPRLSGSPSP